MKHSLLATVVAATLMVGCGRTVDFTEKEVDKVVALCVPNGGVLSIRAIETSSYEYMSVICVDKAVHERVLIRLSPTGLWKYNATYEHLEKKQ